MEVEKPDTFASLRKRVAELESQVDMLQADKAYFKGRCNNLEYRLAKMQQLYLDAKSMLDDADDALSAWRHDMFDEGARRELEG